MSAPEANPRAFPRAASWSPDGRQVIESHAGMTLRDWFAGQALMGMFAAPPGKFEHLGESGAARDAYLVADALLAARSSDGVVKIEGV